MNFGGIVRTSGLTDVGKVREVNQDSFAVIDLLGLYLVADGMGGHAAGEKASLTAVSASVEVFSAYDFNNQCFLGSEEKFDIDSVIKIALNEGNNRIIKSSITSISLQGMGTTEVIAIKHEGTMYIGHVGDSRAYLIKNGEIKQLTRDHSVVQDLIEQGLITDEEARVHPYRNVITRCLGMQSEIEVDVVSINLESDDIIILCTDGLTNLVSNQEIMELVYQNDDPNLACEKLINLANQRGGHDNITVVILYNDEKIS